MDPFPEWLAWMGLSYRELAAAVGQSEASIRMAVKRRSAHSMVMGALANVLQVPREFLLTVSPKDTAAQRHKTRLLSFAADHRLNAHRETIRFKRPGKSTHRSA